MRSKNKINTFNIINNDEKQSIVTAKFLKQLLLDNKWEFNTKVFDYLIIVGGDGTYVRSLRKCYDKNTRIVCVNTGTIGFYSKFHYDQINDFVNQITSEHNYEKPQILEIKINNNIVYNAMNEVVIQSLNTVKIDVKFNDIKYERYMGTGVLVSTRTGSTGQAKANQGAIILPNVDAIEFVELAPTNHSKHHSFNSPVILHGSSKIEFSNFYSSERCDLIIDGMRILRIKPTDVVTITKRTATFSLCFSENIDVYIKKLQKTFLE